MSRDAQLANVYAAFEIAFAACLNEGNQLGVLDEVDVLGHLIA